MSGYILSIYIYLNLRMYIILFYLPVIYHAFRFAFTNNHETLTLAFQEKVRCHQHSSSIYRGEENISDDVQTMQEWFPWIAVSFVTINNTIQLIHSILKEQ